MFWKDTTGGLKAFYEVLQKIAAAKKLHNIGDQLTLPCCKDIISNVLESFELQKPKHVSLSNNTISRRITELSDNILSQVVSKIQNSMFNFFAMQTDETTDVANLAQLCVFLCYVFNRHLQDEIHEFLHEATAKQIMCKKFSDDRFLICLLFFVDIFESINSVNLALQGREIIVLHCHEKLTAFKMKLPLAFKTG